MARRISLFVIAGLLPACAQLAGIGDANDPDPLVEGGADASDAGVGVPVDASKADVAPVIPATASFDVRCEGTVLKKVACDAKRWEYDFTPCQGVTGRKVVLENTGTLPVAYIARRYWPGGAYVPNQGTDGSSGELVGVIGAGEKGDISTAYNGGIFALVGSIRPFDLASLTARRRDEGKVVTNASMLGSFPTNDELDVAELTATSSGGTRCTNNAIVFANK